MGSYKAKYMRALSCLELRILIKGLIQDLVKIRSQKAFLQVIRKKYLI